MYLSGPMCFRKDWSSMKSQFKFPLCMFHYGLEMHSNGCGGVMMTGKRRVRPTQRRYHFCGNISAKGYSEVEESLLKFFGGM